jgi:hypothetical protein
MPLYRPRIAAELTVPVMGASADRRRQEKDESVIQLPLRPTRCRIVRNNHNVADCCTVTVDWTEAGVDPRLLGDATLEVHIANANDFGEWTPGNKSLCFAGITKQVKADRDSGSAGKVEIECDDYTTLFLHQKPFPSAGVPTYDQTLTEAWQRIVAHTDGAESLSDRIFFEGGAEGDVEGIEGTPLSASVAQRFAKLAQVPAKPGDDAWTVWQQCVSLLGLISFIHLDKCVVTTARNFYTANDPPLFRWGQNILSWSETRNSERCGKGVGVTSFDPLTLTTLEAFYPPIGDPKVKQKHAKAKKAHSAGQNRANEERDYYALPGITEQAALDKAAERIYEETRRQELEGRIVTKEMSVKTLDGELFNLLSLRAGDAIYVDVTPDNLQLLRRMDSDSARIAQLRSQGYEESVAELIVKNLSNLGRLSSTFHIKCLTIELEFGPEEVNFSVEIEYMNQIQIDGSAT